MKLLERVVERTISKENQGWAMDINYWDWVPGVGLYGIYKAWERTKREDYLNFLQDWFGLHLSRAYDLQTVNSTAPLLTAISLYEHNKREEYLKTCIDIADWILGKAPRTPEGGLEHTVTEKTGNFSGQIWADTLFMVCIFLAKLGRITGNRAYTDEAKGQLLLHHKYLSDPKTGLYYHGYNFNTEGHMSGALWGRANAWIIISTVEILSNLEDAEESFKEEILGYIERHVSALAAVQREDGMFGTLLDCADSYNESSATAGISAGIKYAVSLGYVDRGFLTVAERAEEAVRGAVSPDGGVEGVSTGTPIMKTQEDYKSIKCCHTLYGQALTLMMLSAN